MKLIFCFFLLLLNLYAYSQKDAALSESEKREILIAFDSSTNTNLSFKTHLSRAMFYQSLKNYPKAMNDYNKAIELDSTNYITYYNRATLKSERNDKRGALSDYSKSLLLGGNVDYKVYYNRASLKSDLKDYNGSITDYTRSLDLEPENSLAFHNRAKAKGQIGLLQSALEDYDKAIKIDPFFTVAYQNRAICKAKMGDKTALNDFNKVIELAPNSGEAYANRALFYIHQKVNGDYCSDLIKALELGFKEAQPIFDKKCRIVGK